ncbi:glycogen debranching N-terminal domain-containing protein [Egicoccus sp. AB-alg6-2]|uniref:amylo-alpha-1,6-glucosidase n=1 Tax=Egicoccus sp. AB-alg6-2 TaxID=3242692 RepID=UPI00359E4A01
MTDLGPLSEIVCVRADSFAISGPNGDIEPGGDHGLYVRDTRFLHRLELLVDGLTPVHLAGASVGGNRAVFHAYLPPSRDTEIDATVTITRRRVVDGGLCEQIDLANHGAYPQVLTVALRVGTDFAYVFDVKHGRTLDEVEPSGDGDRVWLRRAEGVETTQVRMPGGAATDGILTAEVRIDPGTTQTLVVEATASDAYGEVAPHPRARQELTAPMRGVAGTVTSAPSIRCSETRFSRLVRRSVGDLRSLELQDPEAPGDRFAAAGSPWFLTLFGRDSIWAAFMALPYDLGLARGTLRVLARRQGRRSNPGTEEEPGKILHEVRRGALAERGDLPPFYYGSVDATPLFVVLANEAWRWGLPDEDLLPLLPHVEAALTWMRTHGDPDGDGFIEYLRHGERGLANQGWKDSSDGIRFADGRIALAPLALCEVQGYAYEAAVRGADLLDHFGRPGGDAWRAWAADLADRFRTAFWVQDAHGRYPAVALDGDKTPVDGVASNMGHLLATGLLDAAERALVAERLGRPDLASGWGLRTLSADGGGYNPLSYHCGAVWPHDTSIAVWGLARGGHAEEATRLLRGLVRAAPTFNYRLPELFSGFSSEFAALPVPYPTSCRPQAWAAGGVLLLVRALFGIEAHVPQSRLTVRPMIPAPFERLELTGIPLAGGTLDLSIRDGDVAVRVHDIDIDVLIEKH